MPRPIGYKPTPEAIARQTAAIRAAHERKRQGIEKPPKREGKRQRVNVNGRNLLRPDPSAVGHVVLTIEEWKAALEAARR